MRGDPITIVRAQALRHPQELDAAILIGWLEFHVADLAQAGDEVVDMACARHARLSDRGDRLLEKPDRRPRFPAGGIVGRLQDGREVEHMKPARFDQ